MPYVIILRPSAKKDLKAIDEPAHGRIIKALRNLANNPATQLRKKLAKTKSAYRIRVGDYRILYEVYHQESEIKVFRIAHRREAYR